MASGRSMHGTQSRRRRRTNGWGSGAGASTRRCCRASSRRSGRTRSENRHRAGRERHMVSGTLLGEQLGPPFRCHACQQSNIVRSTQGGCSFGRETVACDQLNNFVQFDRFFTAFSVNHFFILIVRCYVLVVPPHKSTGRGSGVGPQPHGPLSKRRVIR